MGAALVIIIAGMRLAQAILVPFLMAVFIAIITGPLLTRMKRRKIPTAAALLLIMAGVIAVTVLTGMLLGGAISDFTEVLPHYQEKLRGETANLAVLLESYGIKSEDQHLLKYTDPAVAMGLAGKLLAGLGGLLSNTFLILLTVVFILLEASTFREKLRAALGHTDDTYQELQNFLGSINRYMVLKTWISVATGVLTTAWLALLGVDFPILLGFLAFLFNYVPNIGAFIAAVPAVLLALIGLGPTPALLVAIGLIVIHIIIGNILEPRYMGKGLGLSTLVVFLSLVFWGWVLGPVGMLLSVPLTMTIKIALASHPQTVWIDTLLGDQPEEPMATEQEASR
jgi:predicted PurR-regulated permease PerM